MKGVLTSDLPVTSVLTASVPSVSMLSMLKIRLQRVGRTNNPSFRIVLTDSKNGTRSGKTHEVLGHFDFRKDSENKIDGDRVKYWMSKGAQATPTVHNHLINMKVISGKKINVLPRKSPPAAPKAEEAAADPKAASAAAAGGAGAGAATTAEAPAATAASAEPVEAPIAEAKVEAPAA